MIAFRALVLASSAAALAACAEEIAGPEPWPVSLEILREITEDPGTEEAWRGPPVVTVAGGEGAVTVEGDFLLPCVNYGVRAEGERRADTLLLKVRMAGDVFCANLKIKYAYRARMRRLDPGFYTVRVFHELFLETQGGIGLIEVQRSRVPVN
ncbi:MAG: hypothetical protein KatS3mg081_0826 [Gemmatimonadales bacterium]|nr:hypothetical protein HRbin33_00089 [bacterium HR33]GIW51471.1 MAG: hypothetical protein KatS3mg081_0826 [Gemmatimonadales bacterium]